jgi:exonuclease III
MLADRVADVTISKNYRGSLRPSDHVPVTATMEV